VSYISPGSVEILNTRLVRRENSFSYTTTYLRYEINCPYVCHDVSRSDQKSRPVYDYNNDIAVVFYRASLTIITFEQREILYSIPKSSICLNRNYKYWTLFVWPFIIVPQLTRNFGRNWPYINHGHFRNVGRSRNPIRFEYKVCSNYVRNSNEN